MAKIQRFPGGKINFFFSTREQLEKFFNERPTEKTKGDISRITFGLLIIIIIYFVSFAEIKVLMSCACVASPRRRLWLLGTSCSTHTCSVS